MQLTDLTELNGSFTAADFAQIESTIYQCMDIRCLCDYLEGTFDNNGGCTLPNGKFLQKSYRKEYRLLTQEERDKLHNALWEMKNTGEYDKFSRIHRKVENGGAHAGPAFLPWHREFLKRVEFSLKQVDPSISLPYIDWTLDSSLDNSKDSILFSKYLLGEPNGPTGYLVNGPFVDWRTIENCRVTYTNPALTPEFAHGIGHMFVGGDMGLIPTSSNDPIFLFHHTFLDSIYEEWRQKKQSRAEREKIYPGDFPDCANAVHFRGANMYPFVPMKNIDGLTNKYTDNIYEYAPRPTCSVIRPETCGSDISRRFLFCDLSHVYPRCSSKLKPGAKCDYYSRGEEPCYGGKCEYGVCVLNSEEETTMKATTPMTATAAPATIKPLEDCYNEHNCCAAWAAKGECQKNEGYMGQMCPASCGLCSPSYQLIDAKKKATPAPKRCENTDECSNENVCCPLWALRGDCTKAFDYMSCNCRISCSLCETTKYDYGSCVDYDARCPAWGLLGECQSNKAVSSNKDNKRPEFNGKAERKEYRQLTNEERQKVNSAFWVLKHELSATAHAGPGFLPYHREFLLRLELMLRKVDPDISLPYIDLTLDSNLDDPKQSVLFSNDLMGDTNGPSGLVADGPFKDWPTTTGGQGIERAVGVEGKGYPMTDVEVKELLSGNLTNWLGYSVPQQGCFIDDPLNTIEFLSGDNNIFIGGTMKNIRTQFDDPLAVMSMAFIDMLWEQFRQTKQSPEHRETDYPSDEVLCESHHHFLSHVMYPFDKMTVKDGLSNSYTEQFYTYAPRPTCSEQNIHGCRSRFLFCDFSYGEPRCSSKLKPQSSCGNYHRGEAACFQTECTNKICSQNDQVSFSAPALGTHTPTEVAPAISRVTTDVPVVEITTMVAADVPPPTTEAPQRPQVAVAADVPAPTSPPQVGFAAGTSTQAEVSLTSHYFTLTWFQTVMIDTQTALLLPKMVSAAHMGFGWRRTAARVARDVLQQDWKNANSADHSLAHYLIFQFKRFHDHQPMLEMSGGRMVNGSNGSNQLSFNKIGSNQHQTPLEDE
ncbi:hypothetical protein WR25_23547 [Diploscapter pachys]|uniref:ShKT domain-containing protein n=1 Tax=Diploscapter pachys TaxID=2018661 RepID=A0A2A2LIC3_9BILA|nr:hypothetical protein WR25_23547 [Diploscapter pachys]